MPTCNTTLENEKIDEIPIVGSMTIHTLFLIIAAAFSLVAICLSEFLIFRHAMHYSKPSEQKHIIRILFMIPIYALVSFLSLYFYQHTIYYQVLRDCYEAIALAAFFTLLCCYIAPELHDQKEYFRDLTPRNWLPPLNWFQRWSGGTERGWLRIPRSGLTWYNIIFICIFQYCFVEVLFTIIAVITQALGRYCVASDNPAYAHVWVEVFEAVSVTIAMYGLIQFYFQLRHDLAPHKPFLKILSIKLVIFFSFWQTLVISFLTNTGIIKSSDKVNAPDITIGIPALALCIEMAIFSIMHLFAFPIGPYTRVEYPTQGGSYQNDNFQGGRPKYVGGPFGIKACLEAFNPWDILKAVGRSFRWLFVGRKHRFDDPSYKRHTMSGGAGGEFDNSTAYKPQQESGFPLDNTAPVPPPHFEGGAFAPSRQKRYQALSNEDDDQPLVYSQEQTGYALPYPDQGANSYRPHASMPDESDMGGMRPPPTFHQPPPHQSYREPSPYREDEDDDEQPEWAHGDEDQLTRRAPLPADIEGDLSGHYGYSRGG